MKKDAKILSVWDNSKETHTLPSNFDKWRKPNLKWAPRNLSNGSWTCLFTGENHKLWSYCEGITLTDEIWSWTSTFKSSKSPRQLFGTGLVKVFAHDFFLLSRMTASGPSWTLFRNYGTPKWAQKHYFPFFPLRLGGRLLWTARPNDQVEKLISFIDSSAHARTKMIPFYRAFYGLSACR